ncbi:protein CURVATURE THYLAKOID 1A, chloroplastic [Impatiens glandulifera]|uniref:protein CURVATURE THYLAKOID 1A, chloroplastic n=1 Tax=Impatiens glandulifera TaxID=253017 RepID=UPI001FB0C154|nr:protein CURVATURE THYLAKOID 1A, chloroplastic [Impatiens glandulifera]
MATAAYSTSAVFSPCRLPTTAGTTRSSGTPYLPSLPRFSSLVLSTSSKKRNSEEFKRFQVKASSSDSSADANELLTDLKEKWDAVENKSTVIAYGGGAIVAVWLSSVFIGAVNTIPLLPKILELVGLGYTGWFVYRYLLYKDTRKELVTDIEGLKKKIAGTE